MTAGAAAVRFDAPDDIEAINRLYREKNWGDGLPIIPPTVERVERMLSHTSRARDEVVAEVAPAFGPATVERIAINAVMAGCDPEYLPILIAAVEGVAQKQFNLQGIQATTNPVAVWVIVHGPISRALNFNSGFSCLGPGNWANATVGRAMSLILRNIGGALPGEMDRATQGQPAKYTFCCAENEADSPWTPIHVDRGFAPDQCVVTVVGIEGTLNMNSHTKNADELLRIFGETMIHPPSNEYTHGGEPWVIIGPEHADILHRAGISKQETQRRLWEHTKMRAGRMADKDLARVHDSRTEEFGVITDDTMLPITKRPEDILILVTGAAGTHSVYVPSFGNSRCVSRPVEFAG